MTVQPWDRPSYLPQGTWPNDPKCSRCGMAEEDTEWGKFFWVEVITEPGEEGFADIVQLLCERCWNVVIEVIKDLGFVGHHHGGIDFLEADCGPGAYHTCPIPNEQGQYFVRHDRHNP